MMVGPVIDFYLRLTVGLGARSGLFAFSIPNKLKRGAARARQRGQATIEYALLLGIAAGMSVTFYLTFNRVLERGILQFNVTLERELMTGPPEAADKWEN